MKMFDRTPAQVYALVIGGALVFAGIVGFFYSSAFGSPGKIDDVFGVLAVNGWHDVLHIATGVLGLLAFSYGATRTYALALGIAYIGVAIWGAIVGDGQSILSIIPVNTEDTVLHAIIGVLGLGAFATTRRGYPEERAQPAGA
jgi:hypothetical protein